MKTAALLSCVATATAFQSSSFSGSQVAAVTSAKGGMSMAFEQKWFPNKQLVKTPEKLDGTMIGDAGFDPMGITEQLTDLNYVRAAELKHGRVAMIAVIGFVVQQYVQLPGRAFSDPFEAVAKLPLSVHAQIFAAIAVVELLTELKTINGEGEPGDYGFGSKNLEGKSEDYVNSMKLKEIKNGRLAMIAIIGLFVQKLSNGKLPFEWF